MASNILQQYTILVDFLGKTLGPDYEVVLHDLSPGHNQIIAIANGHISGRSIGGPLTDAVLKMLTSKAYQTKDYISNYKGITENGHILRSSTMFIKDESGSPIGLLCINFDDSRFIELHKKLLSTVHPEEFWETSSMIYKPSSVSMDGAPSEPEAITENFSMDIPSLMQKIFEDATVSLATPIDHLNQTEKKEIIQKLQERGMFQLKGAINYVAKRFCCSSATVYRYLSELTN